jgi:hypothetical protein
MKAYELKLAIENLLEQHSKRQYVVVDAQRRKSDAENIFTMPQVTVLYAKGNFDKSKSSVDSPYHHDASFNVHILVAAKATVNLAVLQNPAATNEQLASAIAESGNVIREVDAKLDCLIDVLYDIIMRPEHRKLGCDYNPSRWVPEINKHNPEREGAIIMGAATLTLVAQCSEEVSGEIGVPAGERAIDTIVDLGDQSKQGANPLTLA